MDKIALIDHYTMTPAELAKQLAKLDEFLIDRSTELYRCTCEDDDEHPRGYMEYDTNAYIHHDDCPSGMEYHWHVLLAGLAEYFGKAGAA